MKELYYLFKCLRTSSTKEQYYYSCCFIVGLTQQNFEFTLLCTLVSSRQLCTMYVLFEIIRIKE